MKHTRKWLTALVVLTLYTAPLWAQSAGGDIEREFQASMDSIRNIAAAAGALVGGLVGVVGIGRTAWKLANGETDAMNTLIMAVVGLFLGFLATLFLN